MKTKTSLLTKHHSPLRIFPYFILFFLIILSYLWTSTSPQKLQSTSSSQNDITGGQVIAKCSDVYEILVYECPGQNANCQTKYDACNNKIDAACPTDSCVRIREENDCDLDSYCKDSNGVGHHANNGNYPGDHYTCIVKCQKKPKQISTTQTKSFSPF